MCIITLEKHLLDVEHYSFQHKYTRIDGEANLIKYLFNLLLLTQEALAVLKMYKKRVRQDNQTMHQCK